MKTAQRILSMGFCLLIALAMTVPTFASETSVALESGIKMSAEEAKANRERSYESSKNLVAMNELMMSKIDFSEVNFPPQKIEYVQVDGQLVPSPRLGCYKCGATMKLMDRSSIEVQCEKYPTSSNKYDTGTYYVYECMSCSATDVVFKINCPH